MAVATDLDDYREQARAWLAANLDPRRAGGGRRAGGHVDPADVERQRELQRRMYEAGYLGITVPREYGGQGLTPAHQRAFDREAAAYDIPMPGGIATSVTLTIVLPTLLVHGSEEQKREWVPRMLRGDEIWVQLLSEPGAGSDLAGLLTRATRDGDTWVLQGTKVWSSGAMAADHGVCLARTSWDVPKHRGLTWFKVPLHDERVTVRPVREINGSAEFCEEFLDDVVVTDDMVIGDVDDGWRIANTMLAFERGAVSPGGGGHGGGGGPRGLAPDLVAIARRRGTTGDAAVRQLIARAHVDDWMHAQMTGRVVERLSTGDADPAAASLIKLGLGILQPRRAAIAMELAGRAGVAWDPEDDDEAGPANAYLNGRIMSIAGGSDQIQRNIIGERLLGLPREPSADADKPFRDVLRDAKSWGAGRG